MTCWLEASQNGVTLLPDEILFLLEERFAAQGFGRCPITFFQNFAAEAKRPHRGEVSRCWSGSDPASTS